MENVRDSYRQRRRHTEKDVQLSTEAIETQDDQSIVGVWKEEVESPTLREEKQYNTILTGHPNVKTRFRQDEK